MSKQSDLVALSRETDKALSTKNYALNGNFTISQRGTYSTATSFTSGDYFVDRWRADRATVTGTVQRIADGYKTGLNSIKVAATSTGTGNIGFAQRWNKTEQPQIYSGDTDQYVVFSAWVKSNSSEANLYIYHSAFLDAQSHSGNGQWEYLTSKVKTSSLNGANNTDFNVFLYDNANVSITSGDYIEIAMAQIEVNTTGEATSFEHRSYGDELARCQRYYYDLTTSNYAYPKVMLFKGNYYESNGKHHPVPMRTSPTSTFGEVQEGGVGGTTTVSSNKYMGLSAMGWDMRSWADGTWRQILVNLPITFDAEL